VREAFAGFLARNPSMEDVAIAKQLATDKHPQVARAGEVALAATTRKRHTK